MTGWIGDNPQSGDDPVWPKYTRREAWRKAREDQRDARFPHCWNGDVQCGDQNCPCMPGLRGWLKFLLTRYAHYRSIPS